ncbi:TetR/AcrR family transcriptional regulator [Amycolatopsis endophytica]|uniref:AcrR family transcriptional regulator n=1 Tax=Amycolatopsis endophytica TaxID=860233 RepID=A0A853B6B0_9PSEU|nr:TetR family transcriptional regulator [Amycolatopsis endophytica]NYI90778.1 AcrR family transcriptional regulator [Amycolatopsis endophytica]
MPRWIPRAEERLRDAAVELFAERGFENVTVADITERAGLTRRTFSRYFTDKRDVLFAGSEQLADAVRDAVAGADEALPPWQATATALRHVGDQLVRTVPTAGPRRVVIRASPELQERERTKFALVASAIADALRERGASGPVAAMLAEVSVAALRAAFDRWLDDTAGTAFSSLFDDVTAELLAELEPARSVR